MTDRPTASVRRRETRRLAAKAGLAPGTLVHVGDHRAGEVGLTRIVFTEGTFEESRPGAVAECFPLAPAPAVTWLHVTGLHRPELIEALGAVLELHPLLQEDILNTDQRPKVEDYGGYLFLILKPLEWDAASGELRAEQISLILGPNWVVTFEEREPCLFLPVLERLRTAKGRIRKGGADYLAYALVDAVVDRYFEVLEKLGEKVEDLDESLMAAPDRGVMNHLHALRQELIVLRKAVWPLREVLGSLERDDDDLIQPPTRVYFRDVYDHSLRIIENLESYREMVSGMQELYLSSVSHRLNEVMKVLTVFTAIFAPLTFIVGVYGMNFRYLPELELRWAYPALWAVMAAAAGGMVWFFRRRKWL
jgi:magnesium transporter